MNERRMKAQRAVTQISVIVGIFPVLTYLFTHLTATDGVAVPYVLWGGCLVSALLAYLLGLSVLDWLLPWKKLVISAEFNGILPKETREKARAAKDHFHKSLPHSRPATPLERRTPPRSKAACLRPASD